MCVQTHCKVLYMRGIQLGLGMGCWYSGKGAYILSCGNCVIRKLLCEYGREDLLQLLKSNILQKFMSVDMGKEGEDQKWPVLHFYSIKMERNFCWHRDVLKRGVGPSKNKKNSFYTV